MRKIPCFSLLFVMALLVFFEASVSAMPVDGPNRQDARTIVVGIGNAALVFPETATSAATTPSHPHYLPPQIASYPSIEKPKDDKQNQEIEEETERSE